MNARSNTKPALRARSTRNLKKNHCQNLIRGLERRLKTGYISIYKVWLALHSRLRTFYYLYKLRAVWPRDTNAYLSSSLSGPNWQKSAIADLRIPTITDSGAQQSAMRKYLESVDVDIEKHVTEAADQACDHIFDLLGSGPMPLGQRIDWHRDYLSGHKWDRKLWFQALRPAPYPGGYDIKYPWELSRFHHFAWLGQAYWLTGREKYAEAFGSQVLDWIETNPVPYGVNWASTMDVAIRMINWLWAFQYLQTSPSLSADFRSTFFRSLLEHGHHIDLNQDRWGPLTNNHFLANLLGLVFLGTFFPQAKEATRWLKTGWDGLQREINRQSLEDGGSIESSISYHRLALEAFVLAAILIEFNGLDVSSAYAKRLAKMLEFSYDLMKPDGTSPMIGDQDNGRILRLRKWLEPEREWIDFRYLLALGGTLLNRDDFCQGAENQWLEALWLMGDRAHESKQNCGPQVKTAPSSRHFPATGIVVMRHSDTYLVLDSGPTGLSGYGSHAHNDALSFEYFTWGRTWIVDPGTYLYTRDHDSRNQFRATRAHNTVVVDGAEQNQINPEDLFKLLDRSNPNVQAWTSDSQVDWLWARHSGYCALSNPIIHHRQIMLKKDASRTLIVRDKLEGIGSHRFDLFIHLDRGVRADFWPYGIKLSDETREGRVQVQIVSDQAGEFQITEGWVSPSYGIRESAAVLQWTTQSRPPVVCVTLLRPFIDQEVDANWATESRRMIREAMKWKP